MHRLHFILLQIQSPTGTPELLLKAGILVVLLVLVMLGLAIVNRWQRNRLYEEKILQQERFDTLLMENRIAVQEDTFNSLGTELHDNIGQLLSTAKMLIGITEREYAPAPPTLLSANETLDKAILELRDLSKSLHKDWLEQFDLFRSLHTIIERINAAGSLRIELKKSSPVLPVSAEQQFLFFRLVQEGIQNVIKHAAASHLLIEISYQPARIRALLQDNGRGFDVRKPAGLGMQIMRQRIGLLNGDITWDSSPAGTRLLISFPVKKNIV